MIVTTSAAALKLQHCCNARRGNAPMIGTGSYLSRRETTCQHVQQAQVYLQGVGGIRQDLGHHLHRLGRRLHHAEISRELPWSGT
jgi:hypothetical protein